MSDADTQEAQMIRTLLPISLHKITAFFGGRRAFVLVCILLCICFGATAMISGAKSSEDVHVAIVDLCQEPLSESLCLSLSDTEGIRTDVFHTISDGEDCMLFDSAEVLLIIPEDYDQKIAEDTVGSIVTLKTAPGAGSVQLLRETVAGLLTAQRSEVRVKAQLVTDGIMTEDDDSAFRRYMDEITTPRIYTVDTYGKKNATELNTSELLHASYSGVGALALLLVLLTLTRRMSDAYSKNVSERIETQQNGSMLAMISDLLALFAVALLISAEAFLLSPEKSFPGALAWICYSLCVSGICLLISRFNTSGRIDILAPFLAIVTSLFGGCFTDLSVLSEGWRFVARCMPQGQMLAATNGHHVFCLLLIGEGAVAVLAAVLLQRKKANRV